MADKRFVVMTVECPTCKTKQKVHVAARTGFAQMGDQTIQCLRCDNYFKATVPDRIIRGPFPAELVIAPPFQVAVSKIVLRWANHAPWVPQLTHQRHRGGGQKGSSSPRTTSLHPQVILRRSSVPVHNSLPVAEVASVISHEMLPIKYKRRERVLAVYSASRCQNLP